MSNSSNRSSKGTAVVTGASAGIGKLYAERLAKRGYDLNLVARRVDRLTALANSLEVQYGIRVKTTVADLGNAAQLEQLVSAISTDETVTLLVNNAGTSTLGLLAGSKAADLEAMVNVNIVALSKLSIGVLVGFKSRNHGAIINIGSVLGFHSLPISSIYSGTKGYVMNFTRGLQQEVAGTKVVIQLVMPAATATDIWEISGVPLTALDPATVMTVEHAVDASLSGFDLGESLTLPSVEDGQLWTDYDAARMRLLGASQTGTPATRYEVL